MIMKKMLFALAVAACVFGCRHITVVRNAPVVTPAGEVVDGGWKAHYYSYGTFTTLGSLWIGITTNHTVRLYLNDITSNVSTNNAVVINAAGKSAGEIAAAVIQALK